MAQTGGSADFEGGLGVLTIASMGVSQIMDTQASTSLLHE